VREPQRIAHGGRPQSMRVFSAQEQAEKSISRRAVSSCFWRAVVCSTRITANWSSIASMALDTDEIDSEQLKWVILMVLFNQPGQGTGLRLDGKTWCSMACRSTCTDFPAVFPSGLTSHTRLSHTSRPRSKLSTTLTAGERLPRR